MNPFGIAVVSHTGIEHQVKTFQIRSAFGLAASDHSDAAKAYDAVVMVKGAYRIAGRNIMLHEGSNPPLSADFLNLGRIEERHTGTIDTNDSDLILGGYYSTGNLIDGTLDDVRIYNRALSATEIKQLYNAGR